MSAVRFRQPAPDPSKVFSVITDIAITLMLIACLTAGFFIFRVAGITLDALLVNQPDGPDPFKHAQHPLTTRGESMYRMEKITTGAAYGASAGSILNGMLNAYSPEQWNAIGVLVGIVIAVLTYLTNLYFKIREDNRRSRSRDEPDAEE